MIRAKVEFWVGTRLTYDRTSTAPGSGDDRAEPENVMKPLQFPT